MEPVLDSPILGGKHNYIDNSSNEALNSNITKINPRQNSPATDTKQNNGPNNIQQNSHEVSEDVGDDNQKYNTNRDIHINIQMSNLNQKAGQNQQ